VWILFVFWFSMIAKRCQRSKSRFSPLERCASPPPQSRVSIRREAIGALNLDAPQYDEVTL
jgi:hypothetical protein